MKAHSPTSRPPGSSPGGSDGGSDDKPGDRAGGGDKRERILDAAERVFARQGFYQSRVSEIARDAGVADGTIYLYFKSKDDLLISLFESRMERINQRLAMALADQVTPIDKLMALVRTYLGLVRDHRELAEVLTIELRQSTKFMKEYASPRFGAFLKLVASVIAEGQERGEFATSVPAPHVARMIFGIIDELALAWLLGRGEHFDLLAAEDWVGMLVLDGLKPRAEAGYPSSPTPGTSPGTPPGKSPGSAATRPATRRGRTAAVRPGTGDAETG